MRALRFTRPATLAAAMLSAIALGDTGAAQGQGSERGSRPLRFEDVTDASGVDFRLRSGTPAKRYLIELMGGGVALLDANRDGWLDLYFVNGSTLDDERRGQRREPNRLYRNNRDGTFTDVTAQAGVGGRHWGMGACVGDVNNDGRDDIYVTTAGPNLLYLGQDDDTFIDVAAPAGGRDAGWSSSCAMADGDGDGDLDLYVTNYLAYDLANPPTRTDAGDRCRFRGLPGLEVACGPLGLTPLADRYYENRGDGTFEDATVRSGLADVPPSYGLGAVWGDYDDDGDQDLYVANDEMPNFLFRNEGDGTFTDVGLESGVALSATGRVQGGMGVDFGDTDNDGDLDLIVTNFVDDYNTLYRNNANGTFADITQYSGLVVPTLPYVGWGVALVDLDLDGDLDLPVVNGHLYPQLDAASGPPGRLFGGPGAASTPPGFLEPPARDGRGYRQTNQIFLNLGEGRFGDAGGDAGAAFTARDAASSRGLAVGDLDNDGLVDLVVTHLDEEPSILLNRSAPGNWLMLDLRGTTSNRNAVGARVTARIGNQVLRRDVRAGGSYQSQHDRRLHFGLGAHTEVDELEIRWPSGRVEVQRDVAANRVLTISEP